MNEEELFEQALETPETDRAALLDRLCADNPELRERIEKLLAAHMSSAFNFDPTLQGPSDGSAVQDVRTFAMPTNSTDPNLGAVLGDKYKLVQSIGEGGMGNVYLASQTQPVKRMVAVKVVKAGMDCKAVLARFEAERQALAMMEHPNIAKVLDAGTTEQGRPYFVMELVKGKPITQFCDEHKLTPKERLELFLPVCEAIQHSHQKGIIHRDIKPSNVLVAMYDDRAVPTVIDFGIAKATGQSLTDMSMVTGFGALVGTPEYMSPEQASLNNMDIDTRSDVYSLGVLLYELLSGHTPVDRKSLEKAAIYEILRIVRDVDAPRLSDKLSSIETLPSVAANRKTEPKKLSNIFRGELDWVLQKALEKDRSRRYATANGFARDIQRYLADEIVEARPPSTAYRLRKFVRHHKGQVLAASLVFLALMAGMAGTTWGLFRAEERRVEAEKARENEATQRGIAETNEAKAIKAKEQEAQQRAIADAAKLKAQEQQARAEKQETEAKKQAAIAMAVAKFQTDMFFAVDPSNLPEDPVTKEKLKDKMTVVQAMDSAVRQLDKGSLKEQPLVEAAVRKTIGNTLMVLERYDEAEPNVRKSLELRRKYLPDGHPDIADGLNLLAMFLQGQNKLQEAETRFREAIRIWSAAHNPEHPDVAAGLENLAANLMYQNKVVEAELIYRQILERGREKLPEKREDFAGILANFSVVLLSQNKLVEAETLLRESLAIRREVLPASHPDTAAVLNNLASVLRTQNKLSEAETLFREALEIKRAVLPAGHRSIAIGLGQVASILQQQNKLEEAEPLCYESITIFRNALPAGHPDIATSLNELGVLLSDQNKPDKAEPFQREALEIWRANLPAGHPSIAVGINNLASTLSEQQRFAEAEVLYREAMEFRRANFPVGHPEIATGLNGLGRFLKDQGKYSEAETLHREALEIRRVALGGGHPLIGESLNNLGSALVSQNKLNEAEPFCREALDLYRKARPANHPDIAVALNGLGALLKYQKKYAEAETIFREAVGIFRLALPAGHPNIAKVLENLAVLLKAQNKDAEAEAMFREVVEIKREILLAARSKLSKDSIDLAVQLLAFSVILLELKEWDEAEPLLREALAIREAKTTDSWTTFSTKSFLGRALLGQKKYAEAEPLMVAGYSGMQDRENAIPVHSKHQIPEVLERLVSLYTNWHTDKPDGGYDTKAAEWKKKLDEHNANGERRDNTN
jgi:eukaryotic-like serine/threonine-protein kinase